MRYNIILVGWSAISAFDENGDIKLASNIKKNKIMKYRGWFTVVTRQVRHKKCNLGGEEKRGIMGAHMIIHYQYW